ncbi:PIN domain-containing protein [Streptomyces longwoodensis]|uniref:PIN domain-containing protein n=1 Tax=Streptomyces longwoodensis TaxID=68231 RepID=UPI0033F41E5B
MLVTPLPGAHRDNVSSALRSVHLEASNLRSAHNGSAYSLLLAYLNWSSESVRTLRGQVRGADIDRLILTRRHGALLDGVGHLAGTSQEKVVRGLVYLELDERIEALAEARNEFDRIGERWPRSLHYVVPDSSFFIHHPEKVEAADFGRLCGARDGRVRVLIPLVVIDELDRLKESKDRDVRWRAGYTLGVIDRLLQEKAPAVLQEQVPAREAGDGEPRGEVSLEVLFDPPGHARLAIADDEIVDRAVTAQALTGKPITLVTYDTGQSMRGRQQGLCVRKLRTEAGSGPEPKSM